MKKSKKKFEKRLKKSCPDCDGVLMKVIYKKDVKGVIYSEHFEECADCGYCEKINDKRARNNKIEEDLTVNKPVVYYKKKYAA
jgi:uncharacterized protein with PIN domain